MTSPNTLTVLKSRGVYLTKSYDLDTGKKQQIQNAKNFHLESIEIGNMQELFEQLKALSNNRLKCVVNGSPVSNWTGYSERNSQTLLQREIRFLPLDIDGIDVGEFDPNQCNPKEVVEAVLDKLNLGWLSQYTYIWAWSSSVLSPGWNGKAYLRLWFDLDTPTQLKELKAWAKPIEGLDSAIYSPSQIIYTSAPYFEKSGKTAEDPINQRLGLNLGSLAEQVPANRLKVAANQQAQENKSSDFDRRTTLLAANEQTLKGLKEALALIPSEDYETWCRIGLALSSLKETDHASTAYTLWQDYSAKSDKYSESQASEKWESFQSNTIDYRAIFNEAKPYGWTARKHGTFTPGYHLRPDGVFLNTFTKSGMPKPPIKICAPLYIEGTTRDEENNSWGRLLKWQDADKKEHTWSMPDTLLHGDNSELAKSLASQGLDIPPGKPKDLSAYISSVKTNKRYRCVDRIGWSNNCFVLPDRTIGQTKEDIVYQSESFSDHQVKQKGTMENWQLSIAKYCVDNSRLTLALCSAFAAPVLSLLEGTGEGGGFHFYGSSSTGKSTALQVAASVWGNSDYVRRWRATSNGLEGIAATHNDLPLILDELSELEPRYAGETIYMLANGQGKQRAKRSGLNKKPLRWTNLLLSSGEETLEGIMQKIGSKPNAGQKARLVDISADAEKGLGLFECLHDFDSAKNLSNHLKEATKKAYGEVGIAWLEYLAVNSSKVCQGLREGIDHFKTLHDEDALESQALRVRDRFAICAAAGEIASKQGFTDWPEGTAFTGLDKCFRSWLSDRGSPKNLEDQNFLTQVLISMQN